MSITEILSAMVASDVFLGTATGMTVLAWLAAFCFAGTLGQRAANRDKAKGVDR